MRDQWRRVDGQRKRGRKGKSRRSTEPTYEGAGTDQNRPKRKSRRKPKNEKVILDILAENPEAEEELLPTLK